MHKTQQIYAVTGSTGFLGRHFLQNFAKHFPDARMVLLLNHRMPTFLSKNWETHTAPLDNKEVLTRVLRGVTTLIHFAGITHADSKKEYWLANVTGTKNLIEAAQKNSVQKIIYISTRAINETCGDYAKSKREGELHIIKSNIPFVILRFSEIYGLGSGEGLNGLIKLVRKLPVVPYPRGVGSFAPLFLDDAIEGIRACLERDDIHNRTYVLAGPNSYTFVELVETISNILRLKRFTLPLPQILFRVAIVLGKIMPWPLLRYDQLARMVCLKDDDISQAKADFDFQPRSFEDGLKLIYYVDSKHA